MIDVVVIRRAGEPAHLPGVKQLEGNPQTRATIIEVQHHQRCGYECH